MNTIPAPSRLIFLAILLMAASAILYELLLAAVLSYLLGATVFYFSITIGIFLFALGIGSWFSRRLEHGLLQKFLTIEVILGIFGGMAVPLIFSVYALLFSYLGSHIFNNLFSFLFQAGLAEIIFNGVSFAAIFGIGVLVGIELPVFMRLVNESLILKEALARVFFWDYAGSLAGSVLFPLLLLPALGFLRTGFLIGLLNLAAALILASAMAGRFSFQAFSWFGKTLLIIGVLFLIVGFAASMLLEQFYTRMIFAGNEILWNQTSPYQNILLTKNRDGKIALFLNGELQFQSGLMDKRYHETFAHPIMNLTRLNLVRVLILGGGDGLLLREILKYPAVESVTMVDIDAVMTRLAKIHPSLTAINENSMADPRLTIINDDAFRWLLYRPQGAPQFDLILADLPDPVDEALGRLYSREFYLMAKRNLSPRGLVVTQAGSLPSRFHEAVKKTLKSAGYRVLSLHPVGEDPTLGIAGIFESSFVAASPSAETIEAIYKSLSSGENSTGIISPYLDSYGLNKASAHSLFHPTRSFGVGGSLTARLAEIISSSSDLLLHFRAPRDYIRTQIQNFLIYGRITATFP